jgi:class 3 adenylate cyclase
MTETAREKAAAARAAMRRGDLITAYDNAVSGLAEAPGDLELQFLSVLSLARSGATALAAERFAALGLAGRDDAAGQLAIDIPALGARIAKDRALAAPADVRAPLLRDAVDAYAAIFAASGDAYPGINAAALALWADDAGEARRLAAEVLGRVAPDAADYWSLATVAEAELILGRPGETAAALARARSGDVLPDWQAVASTRRQLLRHCDKLGIDPAVLSALRPPAVMAYSGHVIGDRFPAAEEADVAAAIAELLAAEDIAIGYGSLAGGADILFAEALLARGGELNVVLPFDEEDFVTVSVAPSGAGWIERYRACRLAATTVRFASRERHLGDDAPFQYTIRQAMGRARLRGRAMDAPVLLAAIWDGAGATPGAVAGTAADILFWRGIGGEARILSPYGRSRAAPPAPAEIEPAAAGEGRVLAAILFGDIEGFSRLKEAHLPAYVATVLGNIAKVLDRHGSHVLTRNTWGDAVFAVFDTVTAAAEAAGALHAAVSEMTAEKTGLPTSFRLRVGGHYGPVRKVYDPVQEKTAYMGVEVVRTARIEPITAPGTTYVTEAFAAALALEPEAAFTCDYLGEVDMAKKYGRLPLYSLRAAAEGADDETVQG